MEDDEWRERAREMARRGLAPHPYALLPPSERAKVDRKAVFKALAVKQRVPEVRRVDLKRPPPAIFMDNRIALRKESETNTLQLCDFGKRETYQKIKEEREKNVKMLESGPEAGKSPLDPPRPDPPNLRREELQYRSEAAGKDGTVPLLIVCAESASSEQKRPALILLHDFGRTMYDLVDRMEDLARRGYLAAAIDCRHHGGRAETPYSLHNALRLKLHDPSGPSLLLDTAHDVTSLLDYLELRPQVNAKRIGLLGLGVGGDICLRVAAMDKRVTAVAVAPKLLSLGMDRWEEALRSFSSPEGYMGGELFGHAMQHRALTDVLTERGLDPRAATTTSEKLGELASALSALSLGILDHFAGEHLLQGIAPRPLLVLARHEGDRAMAQDAGRFWEGQEGAGDGRAALVVVRGAHTEENLESFDRSVDQFFRRHLLGDSEK